MVNRLQNVFEKKNNSVYIIAEVGVNHNGSLDTALKLINEAHKSGCDAVKFQKRDLDEIYTQDILEDHNSAEWNFEYLIPLLKELELSKDDYLVIKETCKTLGLDLIVTPFDEKSAEFVSTLGVSAIKIASADMTNLNLIKKCSSYNLPLIISTGMWTDEDIIKCTDFYKKNNIQYALLLTNSTYPTPYESIGLNYMNKLKTMSDVVGYSGHERDIFIPIAAISLGARIVEKHITLNRNQKGPDHKASLLPSQWKTMVKNIRLLEKSLGDNKLINQAEILNKQVFAKSATTIKDLSKGHILLENDITFKAPGKGIFVHEISDFYGKELKKDILEGKCISKNDFEQTVMLNNWKEFNFKKKWGVKCRFHDYDEYKKLKTPVMEFHCSETDLDIDFKEKNDDTELIIHAPEIVDRELVNICSKDERVVQKSIKLLQKSIDKTIEISKGWKLAKPKMVVHLGGMSMDILPSKKFYEKNNHEEMIEISIKNFKRLNFSKDDIDILPENLPCRPWYFGGEWYQYGFGPAEDMIKFCEYFGLKMTYDICHSQLWCSREKISLNEYTKKVMPLVSHMHISDAHGISGEGVQIHEGEIDFESIFKIASKYDFSWVTEIWSGHLNEGSGTYKGLRDLEKNYNKLI